MKDLGNDEEEKISTSVQINKVRSTSLVDIELAEEKKANEAFLTNEAKLERMMKMLKQVLSYVKQKKLDRTDDKHLKELQHKALTVLDMKTLN